MNILIADKFPNLYIEQMKDLGHNVTFKPELGENAIMKMVPILQGLDAMIPSLPKHPVFGTGNQVVSMINSPNTPNSVPSWCEVTIDRRIVPGESAESVLEMLNNRKDI